MSPANLQSTASSRVDRIIRLLSLGIYRIDDVVTVTVSNRDTDGFVVVDGLQLLPNP